MVKVGFSGVGRGRETVGGVSSRVVGWTSGFGESRYTGGSCEINRII